MKGLTVDDLMADPGFRFVAFGKVAKGTGRTAPEMRALPESERLALMRAYAEHVVEQLTGTRA